MLRDLILIVPEAQGLGGETKIPITYNYGENETSFAFTSIPVYTKYCQKEQHPNQS